MGDSPDGLVARRSGKQEGCQERVLGSFSKAEEEEDHEAQHNSPASRGFSRVRLLLLGRRRCVGLGLGRRWLRRRRHLQRLPAEAADNAAGHNVASIASIQVLLDVRHQGSTALLAVDVPKHVDHVLPVHGAGLHRHSCGKVGKADDGHLVWRLVDLSLLGKLAVPSAGCGEVHDDAAGLHRFHGFLGDEQRRLPSRDGRCADRDVDGFQRLEEGSLLGRLESIRALLGVAALACTILLEVYLDPLGTHGGDLVGDVAHIPGADGRTQRLGLADGLKAGNATAQHERAGRRILPGGRHFRAVEAAEDMSGLDDGPVPGHLRLRAQGIHLLGDGDARHCSHINEIHSSCCGLLHDSLAIRRQPSNPRDEDLILHGLEVLNRRFDAEEHVALCDHYASREDLAANRCVGLVGKIGVLARGPLHLDAIAILHQLLAALGGEADALVTAAALALSVPLREQSQCHAARGRNRLCGRKAIIL
mmetsp:Transcript_58790/g.127175  ORF Transcript_58790/g.127175 Transcript_58790/m.127175 type:complete len:477 (-) Transcript_58790:67-1497(-)